LGDKRRPAGGRSDGATGIGASELVDWPDLVLEELAVVEAVLAVLARAASCEGCGALPGAGDAAPATPGSAAVNAQARQHARMTGGRDITRE
jgi:hypothetical protein